MPEEIQSPTHNLVEYSPAAFFLALFKEKECNKQIYKCIAEIHQTGAAESAVPLALTCLLGSLSDLGNLPLWS